MPKYKRLVKEDRYQVYSFMKAGWKQSEIAVELKVAQSTVSRELRRNRGKRDYRPKQAHDKATRRKLSKNMYVKMTDDLKAKIIEMIKIDWSPEQISGVLAKQWIQISHETIYSFISDDKAKGGHLYKHLRCKKKRKKRYGSIDRRGAIKNRVSIEERPNVVEERSRVGDWEADTVIGRGHKGVIVTLVERKTRFTIIRESPSKKASDVTSAILDALTPLKNKVKTITFDNGKEFAFHEEIARKLHAKCYFARPYHSWERGTNENTNGLIRQYFPKNMPLTGVKRKDVKYVMNQLNFRPRKILNFERPVDHFFGRMLELETVSQKYALTT